MFSKYPEHLEIKTMYFDCSNMSFVNKMIRDYKVLDNDVSKMDQALISVIV